MTQGRSKVLVYGYGNPGRLDDGLGPACIAAVEDLNIEDVITDSNYQLYVEDAEAIAKQDIVVFVDADVACIAPFKFEEVLPQKDMSFSTHSVSASALLEMAHDLFGGKTKAYILGIRGYAFNEFEEGLSEKAQANLDAAVLFLQDVLTDRKFDEYSKDNNIPSTFVTKDKVISLEYEE